MTAEASWSPERMERERVVRYDNLVPCTAAFIDAKTPGSDRKENFTIIGPGVAENPRQHVHIREKHGFNIGGARQPSHITNSQHSHETAEVFIVVSGQWAFRAGVDASDAEVVLGPGDLISVPTRVFRGFENVGQDGSEKGFLFAILGGDDPGRVTWAPQVIRQAEGNGLILLDDGSLIDTTDGDSLPANARVVRPLEDEQVARFDRITSAELEQCVVRGAVSVHGQSVIGLGQEARLSSTAWPHGFQVESVHGHQPARASTAARVLLVVDGSFEVRWEDGTLALRAGDTFTAPRGLEVGLEALGQEAHAFMVTGDEQHAVPAPLPRSMYLVPAAAVDE